uniref:Phospholipase A2 n=1 Tax=Capra hircus TaxID=9925 RepID=A0A8C2Y0X5_CAPHI
MDPGLGRACPFGSRLGLKVSPRLPFGPTTGRKPFSLSILCRQRCLGPAYSLFVSCRPMACPPRTLVSAGPGEAVVLQLQSQPGRWGETQVGWVCVGSLRVQRGGSGWNVEVRPLPPDKPRSLGVLGLPVMEGCKLWAAGLGGTLGCRPCFLPTVTSSDCYVTLWLPTASSHQLQTRTVKNCRNPVWNQSFHFRIHSQIKNIVHLRVFDQDLLTTDDPVLSVLFDVGTLRAGETRRKSFSLSPQERLEVEFRLQNLTDDAEYLFSNGILVARELSCLHVRLEKAGDFQESEGRVQLVVPGSCEGPQEAFVGAGSFRFHWPACWEQELSIHLQDAPQEQLKVPLRALPSGQVVRLVFPTSQEPLMKVELKNEEGPRELAVRLGCGPCAEEQAFLSRRKQVVAKALQQALQLDGDLREEEIPVVAVMATGGGIRAMTSLYGQLAGLKALGLLDCVSYITGASGSTWALANLYEDPEWSQKDLAGPIESLKTQVTKSKLGVLAPRQLLRYQQELAERARLGHPTCFTNLWALINEALLHDEPHDYKLSDQREALSRGQNPLPIYCALNTKEQNLTTFEFGEWCEFSPYEVGFPKYGAFIPSELFGSEFFMGRLTKQLPESRICFLEGIWSNLYAANLQDSLYWSSEPSQFWDRWAQARASLDKEQVPLLKIEEPPTVAGSIAEVFTDLLTRRPLAQATHNFLRGFSFHKDYFQHPHFSAWKATKLDGLPNELTPAEPYLCLLDVGYLVNTSCPPLLPPTRDVDLILSLDYNLHGAFQVTPKRILHQLSMLPQPGFLLLTAVQELCLLQRLLQRGPPEGWQGPQRGSGSDGAWGRVPHQAQTPPLR